MIELALDEDRYDVAGRIYSSTIAAARKANESELAKQLAARQKEIEILSRNFQSLAASRAVLETDPADPAANLAVGKFLAFEKGDWQAAYPHLALGSDVPLAALAKAENNPPTSSDQQAVLGDTWWQVARDLRGEAQHYAHGRASFWLRSAVEGATGIDRVKYAKQHNEVDYQLWEDVRDRMPDRPLLAMSFEPSTRYEHDGVVHIADRSNMSRISAAQGRVELVPGVAGTAVEFDGSSYLAPTGDFPSAAMPRTMMMWIKAADISRTHSVLYLGRSKEKTIRHRHDARLAFCLRGARIDAKIAADTDWHHHCLIYDGSQLSYVFDGQLAVAKRIKLNTKGGPFAIGADVNHRTNFSGALDELLVFRRALNEAEVKELYYRGLMGRPIAQ